MTKKVVKNYSQNHCGIILNLIQLNHLQKFIKLLLNNKNF